jgi:hypothetical protein
MGARTTAPYERMSMNATSDELRAFLDRESIRDCMARLARGEDRRDADLIRGAYWPDATTDYGVFQGSFDDYLAWVVPGADAITNTQHVIGQSYIELDGDSARVETQVISYHRVAMGGPAEQDTCIGGRYLDVMERRDGKWAIRQRTMLYDWYQGWGDAIDWSQGVMGMPFAADHYPGKARGDYSLGFFGRG